MDAFGADDRKQLAKLWSFKRKLPLQEDKQPEEDATSLETASVAKKEAKKAKFLSRGSFASRRNNTEEERRVNLAKACADRLAFSQFRSINEYLYSHSSEDAQAYMDEEMFDKYHSAYEEIAAKWPVKPIDEVIKLLEKVYSSGATGRVLVEMGCGSKPLLHRHFTQATVNSFDLVSQDDHVTQADIAHVPLDKKSCDCVVFCLSLMGTNVNDYLTEANRILKTGGSLVVAEVSSRFEEEKVETFVRKLESGYGFKLKVERSLPPNDFFVLLHLVKAGNIRLNEKLPQLSLKPCIYKPR